MSFGARKTYLAIMVGDKFSYISIEFSLDGTEIAQLLDELNIPSEVFLLEEVDANNGKIENREPIFVNDTMVSIQKERFDNTSVSWYNGEKKRNKEVIIESS